MPIETKMDARTKHARFILFAFSGLVLILLGLVFNVAQYLNFSTLDGLIRPSAGFGPLVFIAIQALVVAALIPASPLTVAAGILFNPFFGIIYSAIASTLGASIIFFGARKFGSGFLHDWLERRSRKYYQYLKKSKSRGFVLTLFLRAVGIVPFHMLSILLGLSHVRFRDYFFATLLGVIPSTALFVLFGKSISIANGARVFSLSGSLLIIAWLIIIGLGAHFKHKYNK